MRAQILTGALLLFAALPAAADGPTSLLAFVDTPASEQAQVREKLDGLLREQGGSLLDRPASDAALRAFLQVGAAKASDEQLAKLAQESGAERVVIARKLPGAKDEKLVVYQVRVVGKRKGFVRLFSVEPGSIATDLAKRIADLLPHQKIEESTDPDDKDDPDRTT